MGKGMLSYSCFRGPLSNRRWWFLGTLAAIQLLMGADYSSAQTKWRREFETRLDGRIVDCAFAGGMQFSKPAFVDIDADGDPDLFVGDADGRVRFFVNKGDAENPRWELVSDLTDSSAGERSFPSFVDIDDDGDSDLFVGNEEGRIIYFRNDGTANSPSFAMISDFYDSIDVGSESTPTFADIDADSDLDLFIGKKTGAITLYGNTGVAGEPSWNLASEQYASIDVGALSVPAFVDIDADGDLDLFLGEEQGNIDYYRNAGNDTVADWELISDHYNSIDVEQRSSPAFADIDGDSDFDLLVGQGEGSICFYRNDGTVYLPSWTLLAQSYLFLDFGANSAPTLADMDDDGDLDLFVGEYDGNINFCRNEQTIPVPGWSMLTSNYFAIEADDYSSPVFADLEADGDLDLFIGRKDGGIDFYRNIGTSQSALWGFVPGQFDFVDVGGYSSPALTDIDGDADLDLFVGQTYGKIYFYRNDGTPQIAALTFVSQDFESVDVGSYSAPTFGDLDSDGDLDLLVGNDEGKLRFYRNDGTSQAFSFVLADDFYDSIDVGHRSTPVLCDFDSDGDLDLFVGESKGGLHYYKNQTLNSIRGCVTDQAFPLEGATVYLSGDRDDSTRTDSSGNYEFVGLPQGDYCVFRDQASFQYCFSPLESDTFEINFAGVTQVDEFPEQNTSDRLQLFPNYPNPFNPLTNIAYYLPGDALVTLTIYNLRGETVRELVNGLQNRGWKEISWDGKNSQGKQVASGVYFCKLQTSRESEIIRMVLLK
jgi:hypothetical protein